MLIKLSNEIEPQNTAWRLEKTVDGVDVSTLGAFACGTCLQWNMHLPRTLGVAAVVLRIHPDGGEARDLPFVFSATERGVDTYALALDTAALCGDVGFGLFYYELLFLRGLDTLFSDSVNNVDFTFARESASLFRLLVFEKAFTTPRWFAGGTMYHVFLDRFCRGAGDAALRPDAILDENWETGIPQFAQKPGDPLKNNVFFGGNLWGVIEKLDFLASLGVDILYLSPMFEAASNHRYDTGDYEHVDAFLGGDGAFDRLVSEAHERGMRVMLDGVFNHTGDDSRYFNARGNYTTVGAANDAASPYRAWYRFSPDGEKYDCWWGVKILPRLNHDTVACRRYFTGEDGIAARWLRRGADAWRLDVADELSDEFLDELRETVKRETHGEGVILGEVWENAADKIAYGKRRRYFSGRQLDSVMNYPFRSATLAFVMQGDADAFYDTLTELYASYPPEVSRTLMNILGTHDTDRILTVLGGADVDGMTNAELATYRLPTDARHCAIERLKLASVLQFTVFGVPSVYYGDEAGLEGGRDPFCRLPYPWGREEKTLLSHYASLGKLRREHAAFGGDFRFLSHTEGAVLYERSAEGESILVGVNCGSKPVSFALSNEPKTVLLANVPSFSEGSAVRGNLTLGAGEYAVLKEI